MTEASLASSTERRETRRPGSVVVRVFASAAVGVLLYLLSRSNYLLFHGIVELFGIVVCFGIFVVAWNTRRLVSNHFLLFLGIAYLFVAAVGIFHTLAYRGMGVFPSYTANQPTQFWILARYLEAFSLLLAPVFLARRLRPARAFVALSLVTGFCLLSICRLGIFPDCYVEGQGLTTFKVASEYVISAVLLAALGFLSRRRAAFEARVFRLLAEGILAGVGAEMAFTLYTDIYGVANAMGHLFKVACFYFIYRAVVKTSLVTPQESLFRTLAQERDRAQSYLDIAGVVLIVVGRDGRVQLINRKGAEVLGYRVDEIVGRDWFHDFLPESRQLRALELFGALMEGRTGGAERTEGAVLNRAGAERTIAWHNSVLRDAGGAIVGMLSSGEDVTEQRASERALEASERRFRMLFDRAPDGYYLSDLDGRFVDANRQAEALVGYRKEELLGKSFLEAGLLRPQDVPAAAALLGRSVRGLPTGPDELTLVRKNGGEVVVEIRTELVGVEGRTLILGIARDATERHAAEEALHASEERYRRLFEGAIEGVYTLDLEGRLTSANPALLDMVHMTVGEALGRRFTEFVVPECAGPLVELFTRLMTTREPVRAFPAEVTLTGGRHLWAELSASQVYAGGVLSGLQGTVRDISERKLSEQRERASRARLESLVSVLQHEATSVQEFLDYALEEAIQLTESRLGYIYLYDEERVEFTLNTWSRDVMKECSIQAPPTLYRLEKTGIWGEAVRQRRPIVVNDFDAPNPLKKGCPPGHAKLRKYATIPVLSGGRIVAVVGVANRDTDYTDTEILQLTLLMEAVWRVVERLRAEQLSKRFSERLESAMAAGNLAWWQMSLPSGDVIFDERKARMLGYPPSQFSHSRREFWNLLHPDDIEAAMQAMDDYLEGRAARYEVEYRIRTASGEYRWFRDVGSVTQRDAAGRPSVVTGIIVDVSHLKETEEQLTASNAELRELAERLDVAREEERAAVAWELHDQVAQSLSVMKMDIDSCRRRLPGDVLAQVRSSLERMEGILDDTIARLRRLYTDLVPVMLEDLGLAAAIEWQAGEFRRQTGVEVEVGRVADLRLPDGRTALGVFRVLQEALENAHRHGGATKVQVAFEPEEGHAVLRVSDNGHGGNRRAGGPSGTAELAAIRERARSWGGEVNVSESAIQGAVLEVTVPLPQQ